MVSRKQHLLNAGKITAITRGRISLENLKWLEEEYGRGVRYSDWSPDGPVSSKSKPVANTVSQTARNTEISSGISESTEFYPESQYVAYVWNDGKKEIRSMREACNNCRVSLIGCGCATVGREPVIVSRDGRKSVPVVIERKV